MSSPSPQPAFGSSRSQGGTLRGGQIKHAPADAQDQLDEPIQVIGRVRLYVTGGRPDNVSVLDKPQMTLRCAVYHSLASLLPVISKAFPSLSGES
jgi:hypothetical protein